MAVVEPLAHIDAIQPAWFQNLAQWIDTGNPLSDLLQVGKYAFGAARCLQRFEGRSDHYASKTTSSAK